MPANSTHVMDQAGEFVAVLDAAFGRHGAAEGMPMAMRKAVIATPRHLFVHRYLLEGDALRDADVDLEASLPAIYSDAVMWHVDRAGERLPSTNSVPSYVLWLLHLLGIERGQQVLEIGSGSGWLAGILGRLVGPEGHVTGVEIIPDLAQRSRDDLAAAEVTNVTIVTGDGAAFDHGQSHYDRVMITAGVWELPSFLFDRVVDGGMVLAPLELRGIEGCQVSLLRREGDGFRGEVTLPGGFVPLVGRGQSRPGRSADTAAKLHEPVGAPPLRRSLPLGSDPAPGGGAIAREFRAFLARTEPGFVHDAPLAEDDSREAASFGLVDDEGGAKAIWRSGVLLGHGGPSAFDRFSGAYETWTELGLPGFRSWRLSVVKAGRHIGERGRTWIERRETTDLIWTLEPSTDLMAGQTGPSAPFRPTVDAGSSGQLNLCPRRRASRRVMDCWLTLNLLASAPTAASSSR